ncbi:helix-turn-helix domain-containing protein [Methylocystis sp.]|uniref:helix-turn-helix domain-containing protein n=1 Tax=Methylocystis sp. TaxID=1911079 RepID=UPI00345C4E02
MILGAGAPDQLVSLRQAAALAQAMVAKKLGRHQSVVATIENGQSRIALVEFVALARAASVREPGQPEGHF